MQSHRSGQIFYILRKTFHWLDNTSGFDPNDPAVVQLKTRLLCSVADLDVCNGSRTDPRCEQPITVIRFR
jgi:hypothetical protein